MRTPRFRPLACLVLLATFACGGGGTDGTPDAAVDPCGDPPGTVCEYVPWDGVGPCPYGSGIDCWECRGGTWFEQHHCDPGPGCVEPAPDPTVCSVKRSYAPGEPLVGHGLVEAGPGGRAVVRAGAVLDDTSDPRPEYLVVHLYEGYGAFADRAIAVGSYPLGGDESAYATCGVCVLIGGNHEDVCNDGEGQYQLLMATGGTLHVGQLEGELRFTLSGVTFVSVEGLDGEPATPGCATTVDARLVGTLTP